MVEMMGAQILIANSATQRLWMKHTFSVQGVELTTVASRRDPLRACGANTFFHSKRSLTTDSTESALAELVFLEPKSRRKLTKVG